MTPFEMAEREKAAQREARRVAAILDANDRRAERKMRRLWRKCLPCHVKFVLMQVGLGVCGVSIVMSLVGLLIHLANYLRG